MLQSIDYIVIIVWIGISLALGVWFQRRANRSVDSFFLSDRSLPWWVVGTSMVATTFAADTPLVVSGWVASHGIAENWVWWNLGAAGVISVFLFSRLWRRANILTDAELVELRYDGRAAAFLRGLKGFWFGGLMNVLVIAWVMGAMTKLAGIVLNIGDDPQAQMMVVGALFLLTVVYTMMSGLYGVVATDVVQFVFAIGGAIGLALLAWSEVGGLAGVQAGFVAQGLDWSTTAALIPDLSQFDEATARFVLLIGVIGLASHNVDGGGYLAQRLFAAKDEQHALLASVWFTVAHYCLRPWPWIVVGLCGMAIIGPTDDPETLYPMMMERLLAPGFYGLVVASFLAAFMSTIDTQLNWGASLLINDLYRRFIAPDADQKHLLIASRLAILLLAAVGALMSFAVTDVGFVWKISMSVTAGLGTVYAARWYWWRTTAWSEITAMFVAGAGTAFIAWLATTGWVESRWLAFPFNATLIVAVSVPAWILVTLYGPKVDTEHLRRFYARVRPGGPGWRAIAHDIEGFKNDGPNRYTLMGIAGGIVTVYGSLMGIGQLITGHTISGWGLICAAVIGAVVVWRALLSDVHQYIVETKNES